MNTTDMTASQNTFRYLLEVGNDIEIEVEVPSNATRKSAEGLFIEAAEKALELPLSRHLVLSKVHDEFSGHGGLFEAYLMSKDDSGHIFGTHWIKAIAKTAAFAGQ